MLSLHRTLHVSKVYILYVGVSACVLVRAYAHVSVCVVCLLCLCRVCEHAPKWRGRGGLGRGDVGEIGRTDCFTLVGPQNKSFLFCFFILQSEAFSI